MIQYIRFPSASPRYAILLGDCTSIHQLSWCLATAYRPISASIHDTPVAQAAGSTSRGIRRSADLLTDAKAASWLPWRQSLMGFSAHT